MDSKYKEESSVSSEGGSKNGNHPQAAVILQGPDTGDAVPLFLDGAFADYGKTIEVKPQYSQAYYYRGVLKFNQKDFEGAITDFTKAIENVFSIPMY